jgi:hypothetical protein
VVDRIFKRLTRLLEQCRRSGPARRKFHADETGEIAGLVHALDQKRPSAVIHHRPTPAR